MLERALLKPHEPTRNSRWKGNIINVSSYTKGWSVYSYHDGRASESTARNQEGQGSRFRWHFTRNSQLGEPKLKACLLSLYNTYWQRQTVPQDFKDALIVKIYKRKGDSRNCDNHWGISLLSITGKVLAKVMLNRLKTISEQLLPEPQCGSCAGRSIASMIFTLRQLQEKLWNNKGLFILSSWIF